MLPEFLCLHGRDLERTPRNRFLLFFIPFLYLYVDLFTWVQVSMPVWREHQFLWSWSYRCFWVSQCGLETKLGSCGGAASALKPWTISWASIPFLMNFKPHSPSFSPLWIQPAFLPVLSLHLLRWLQSNVTLSASCVYIVSILK